MSKADAASLIAGFNPTHYRYIIVRIRPPTDLLAVREHGRVVAQYRAAPGTGAVVMELYPPADEFKAARSGPNKRYIIARVTLDEAPKYPELGGRPTLVYEAVPGEPTNNCLLFIGSLQMVEAKKPRPYGRPDIREDLVMLVPDLVAVRFTKSDHYAQQAANAQEPEAPAPRFSTFSTPSKGRLMGKQAPAPRRAGPKPPPQNDLEARMRASEEWKAQAVRQTEEGQGSSDQDYVNRRRRYDIDD